jgi:hypothetical protein
MHLNIVCARVAVPDPKMSHVSCDYDYDPVDDMDSMLSKMLYRSDDFAMVLANNFSRMFNLMNETHRKWATEFTELLLEHKTRELKDHTQNAPIEERMRNLFVYYIDQLNPLDDQENFYHYVGDRFAATLYYQEIKERLRAKRAATRLQALVRGFLVRRKHCTYNPNTELGKCVIRAINNIPVV